MAPATVRRWRSRGLADHAKPSAVDLFAGAGGSAAGYAKHLDVVRGFDSSNAAAKVYNANHAHGADMLDLSDVPAAIAAVRRFAPTIICGSPPCQDFSSANAVPCESRSRAGLTVSFAEIVAAVRPQAWIMENVPLATLSDEWQEARRILSEAGYGITQRIVCASRVGVPQYRRRLIAWGVLGGEDDALGGLADSRLADNPLTVAEALPDLPRHYYRMPRSYLKRGIFPATEPSPTIRGRNTPRPPPTYKRHPRDAADPADVRGLTPLERAAIQGFPPTWDWSRAGSRTATEQMIGNAVPPPLAAWAAGILIDGLSRRK